MNKNRAEIIALFGKPGYEGDGGNGYTMSYYPPYGSIHFELGTPEDEVWRISVLAPIYGYEEDDSESIEILYDGKPIMNWMGARLADLRDVYGAPDVEGIIGEGSAYGFKYEDIEFIKREQGEDIESISGMPSALSINGTALDTNRDQLVSFFGNPVYEDWGDEEYYAMLGMDNSYYMQFSYQEIYSISFELDDPNGKAWSFLISYSDDGISDDEYWDNANNSAPSASDNSNSLPAGTYWFFTNSLKQNTPTGNVYIAPLEMTTEHFIKYVNILNPDKLDRSVSSIKIKIVSDKNFMGYTTYDIVDSRNTVYTVVDVKIVD